MNGYCFNSELFQIEPGEDEQTNPNRFGKQLAHWLRDRFVARGFANAEVIPEDWGWCVMCERRPYNLWVGCGNLDDDNSLFVWHCFVEVEVPILKRIFKRGNPDAAKQAMDKELKQILAQTADIEFVECPY